MSYHALAGLSLRDIEYVVAVDDLRNFSRAAERCGVSQAGLSEQVKKLENFLGVALFERSRRHVVPTQAGEHLIELGRLVMESARAMVAAARQRGDALESMVRIGVIATLGPYYVPQLLPRLREQYPSLALQLNEGLTETLLEALRESHLDLVIAALPVTGTSFEIIPIFFEPFVAVFPFDHPLAKRKIMSIPALDTEDLLLLEEGHCLRDQALELCGRPPSLQRRQRLAISLEMLWHMIGAGEGYSLIPRLALRNRVELQKLIETRDLPHAGRQIGLIWRKSDPRGAAYKKLAQFLIAEMPAECAPIITP